MDPLVLALVLAAAVLHASWNAIVKSGGDPWVRLGIAHVVSSAAAVAALPFMPFPNAEAWPYIIASAIVHQLYFVFVAQQYRYGDLSHVYPISRGVAPLLVAVGAYLFAGEALTPAGTAAVVVICLAILSLSFGDGWRVRDGRAVLFALGTGATIALYTIIDGLGGRAAENVFAYIVYLFVLQGIPFGVLVLYLRRNAIAPTFRAHWRRSAVGGLLAISAYGLVIWAMTLTPMTYVSALRETSVILAALIGTRVLGEPFGVKRTAAAACVAVGVVVLQISNGT